MPVIMTGEFSALRNEYELLCEECRQPVGWLDRAGCAALQVKGEPVLCFDCEGGADIVPPALIPDDGGAVFWSGNGLVGVIYWATKKTHLSADILRR